MHEQEFNILEQQFSKINPKTSAVILAFCDGSGNYKTVIIGHSVLQAYLLLRVNQMINRSSPLDIPEENQ